MAVKEFVRISLPLILILTLFLSGCGSDKITESDLMKLHNLIMKNASLDCGNKNMIFQSVDMKNFNDFDYYCYTQSPFKIYKKEGIIS